MSPSKKALLLCYEKLIVNYGISFFDNHPEILGQTCKYCVDEEITCGEHLYELLQKFEQLRWLDEPDENK